MSTVIGPVEPCSRSLRISSRAAASEEVGPSGETERVAAEIAGMKENASNGINAPRRSTGERFISCKDLLYLVRGCRVAAGCGSQHILWTPAGESAPRLGSLLPGTYARPCGPRQHQ